ncbi:MAG: hypothetical protein WC718_19150, partial [Phycisphaerales bacterium]
RESTRKAYWATTFRALGDSVHLLQDMAQPQHTRNDWHSGLGCVPGVACALGHASFFENYLQARTLREPFFELKEGFTRPPDAAPPIKTQAQPLEYSGYGAPAVFNSYAEFFATSTGTDNSTGKGLANYSNRGFYSFGTNIGSVRGSSYPSPNPTGSGLNTEIITYPDLKDIAGNQVNGYVKLKTGTVLDAATGLSDDNVRLATVGPWDQFLQQRNASWTHSTLNHYNYDDQARLLVPRAVAYSAGFIDYFFRGTMQISLPDDGVYAVADQSQFTPVNSSSGFTKVKLKLANTTPPIGSGQGSAQDMTGGRLVAVAKFRRAKTTYSTDLSGDCGAPNHSFPDCRGDAEDIIVSSAVTLPDGTPVTSATLAAGAAPQEYHFTFSEAIPLNVTDLYLQVVYRGALGSEADAVVVTTTNIPEPTFLSIFNLTDSVACYKGNWIKLNADGSVPAGIAATIVADGYSLASLAPQAFLRSSLTFKGPFTYPLSANVPLATVNDIPPGSLYRLAVLTDDQKVFDFDIENYQFYSERPLTTAANSIDYDAGSANTLSSYLTKVRDANTFVYRFGYRFLGGDCANTPSPPLDATTADGGTFATPTLVPINTLAF